MPMRNHTCTGFIHERSIAANHKNAKAIYAEKAIA
jgi:hypothetical protein